MTADAYVCPPAPVDPLVEITRQRDEAVKALKLILVMHVPDQPATDPGDELSWALRHVERMRRVALDALSRAEARP